MSVIGIDFGNESCFIAAAVAAGIETLVNDYSLQATPACVAFAGKQRILGVPAKNQQVTNMKNTISNFKRLLGRKFNEPQVQKELQTASYRTEARDDGGIGIRVNYLDQEHVFTPEQVTAMLFTKLKETSEAALKMPIKDCVLTVPSFFTNSERAALIDAANIAGLNILRLLNETTATALLYGYNKTDLPPPEEKPLNVVFVDFGHSQVQASVCAFNRRELRMICSAWDQIGGRDIDTILADYFAADFQKKYKINARQNPQAYLRLLTESEKIKKQMSANSTKLTLNIDDFIDGIDVTSSISRSDMEALCDHLFRRLEKVLRKCLNDSKLKSDEIHAVEIVGGSTRIPLVKTLIEQVFGKTVHTTLNQDEAVSRGAALQCAILSPAVRVYNFSITDIHNTPVRVSWDGEQHGEMEVFQSFHAFPITRQLTIHRREPFNMRLFYADPAFTSDPFIGHWSIKNIKPSATGESQEIRIKIRINDNGLISVTSANIVEKKKPGPPQDGSNMDTTENDASKKDKKKKESTNLTQIPFKGTKLGCSSVDLESFRGQELKMIENDQKEKEERIDARNALKKSVHELREKFSEGGAWAIYIANRNRQSLCQELSQLEKWLLEEGEDCNCEVYRDKLMELKNQTEPVQVRCSEYEQLPNEFANLRHTIQMARKSVAEFRSNTPKYEHITETEILNVSEAADRAQKWLDDNNRRVQWNNRTMDPPVFIGDVRYENFTLSTCLNSALDRPKPPTPPATNAGSNNSKANRVAAKQPENNKNTVVIPDPRNDMDTREKTHSNEDRHSLTPTASTPRPVIATIPVPNSNVAQAQTKQPIANALNRIAEQDIWDNFGATVAQGLREISVPSIQQEAAQVIMADLFRFTTKEREVTGGAASANST